MIISILIKRCIDIFGAAFLLIFLFPIIFVVAIAIFFDLGRPIFFRQNRIGFNEQPFNLIKFRTMRLKEEFSDDSVSDDIRTSRLGKFLRQTSIDEIPSLLLVIRGDLSFVGPRPLPLEYLERMSLPQRRRFLVKPGITGLAQINGRTALGWRERLDYDSQYVESKSLMLDILILFKTVPAVLSRRGADSHESGPFPWFSKEINGTSEF